MPRPRFHKLSAKKRQQILAAAAMEFADHGFGQASLNRIIRAAEISKGAFYYYFDDKADLYGTVMAWVVEVILPRPPPVLQDLKADTFWPEIETWMMEAAANCADRPWLGKLGRQFHHPPPVITDVVADLFQQFGEYLARYMARAQQLRLARTDLPDALLLSMLMATLEASDRWMADNWESLENNQAIQFTQKVMEAARAMIAPPESGAKQ
jgi:AcrR family transcriptional regulator